VPLCADSAYDLFEKTAADFSKPLFSELLNENFKYITPNSCDENLELVEEFLELSEDAGLNETENNGNYEIVISFADETKFNDLNTFYNHQNRDKSNYKFVRIDIHLDDIKIQQDLINHADLTWDAVSNDRIIQDQSLYKALSTIYDESPKGIIYSYYVLFTSYRNQ